MTVQENMKEKTSTLGRLTLVKSAANAEIKPCEINQSPIKRADHPEKQWANQHCSYEKFIHSYIEHLNHLANTKQMRSSSKIMKLFKL